MAIMEINFYSKRLKRSTTLMAVLPVDRFDRSFSKKSDVDSLKVLYLLHGYAGNHMDWLYGAQIVELSLKYNVAIFMPCGENSFYLDDEDREAYYSEYIGNELIEFTRNVFPIPEDREKTFIGGLSMGGYGALRNGLKYHKIFGGIIALSSALIIHKIAGITPDFKDGIASYKYYRHVFGDLSSLIGSDKDINALAKKLKKEGVDIPKIYMACGKDDFLVHENRELYNFLKKEELNVTYEEDEGTHDWQFWNRYIFKAFEWVEKVF
ncbi:S-formylglutathione hydrolase FrmB [Caldicellulosiruptor bescii]|uniref:S-formylglutathione hydrolase FrmB n=2 Tax=Caldicellulosiruptor bescii TaxID=31899 RepID=A0ABY1S4Z4_CALBS|nr:alpha/beta hydrolase-fold protein [Caldicellulosiruptor bescii]ACM59338.1 putative esterase [Caldicellulosiruptor bescii DSM 6725]PBC88205.1 S-formylglutathione hydrolase FrmB [Caldicellulosiruptor bescii]PBC92314.1 S-formylglutathione hydrolase FrmB [Caldicellulosiruptor bescii]PBD04875.1 S-formylglutathione hydrolase FrmB [Caldicellulosiruptor bescii]PBD05495.1 S-formylglutathione hydrolase FrmB [Caldicellulosiruptor bescii]